MYAIPYPTNESGRLAALEQYHILDTAPETVFDHYAALVAQLFHAPISIVGMIDEHRHWFKATVGVSASSNTRPNAFCTHTILSDEVLCVPDATQDARFASNPVVTGSLHIRFYAGAPLMTKDGHRIGTLCIFDTQPREFSASDRNTLEQLATLVMQELERRLSPQAAEGRLATLERVLGDVAGVLGVDERALFGAGHTEPEPGPSEPTALSELLETDSDTDRQTHLETISMLARAVPQLNPPRNLKLKVLERIRFNRRFAAKPALARVLLWPDGRALVAHALIGAPGQSWRVWAIQHNGAAVPLETFAGLAVLVQVPAGTQSLAISTAEDSAFLAIGQLVLN